MHIKATDIADISGSCKKYFLAHKYNDVQGLKSLKLKKIYMDLFIDINIL